MDQTPIPPPTPSAQPPLIPPVSHSSKERKTLIITILFGVVLVVLLFGVFKLYGSYLGARAPQDLASGGAYGPYGTTIDPTDSIDPYGPDQTEEEPVDAYGPDQTEVTPTPTAPPAARMNLIPFSNDFGKQYPGDTMTFGMKLKNLGNATAVGVAPAAFFVTGTSPVHIEPPLTYVSAAITGSNSGCSYDAAEKAVGCNLQNMEPNEEKSVTLTYKIPTTFTCGAKIQLRYGVAVTGVNTGISLETTRFVNCRAPKIEASTTVSGNATLGSTLTYTMTVKNTGDATAVGVAPAGFFVSGTSPAHIPQPFTYLGATITGSNSGCVKPAGVREISCNLQNIEPGQQKVIKFNFRNDVAACGTVTTFVNGVSVTGVDTGLSIKTPKTVTCQ